jgi:ERF superfamily
MKTSDSLINIAKALAEAQKKIGHAAKDSKNPHFKNNYASLESVIDASKEHLLEQGIFVIQSVSEKSLVTRLQHTSGEFFESALDLLLSKQDMQGLGSAITYARRYSLASMLNISQADDDGNEASKYAPQQAPPKKHIVEKVAEVKAERAQVETLESLGEYVVKFGKKLSGQKLKDIDPGNLESYLFDYLEQESKKKNQPLTGPALELFEKGSAYLKLFVTTEPPKLDNEEQIPF